MPGCYEYQIHFVCFQVYHPGVFVCVCDVTALYVRHLCFGSTAYLCFEENDLSAKSKVRVFTLFCSISKVDFKFGYSNDLSDRTEIPIELVHSEIRNKQWLFLGRTKITS